MVEVCGQETRGTRVASTKEESCHVATPQRVSGPIMGGYLTLSVAVIEVGLRQCVRQAFSLRVLWKQHHPRISYSSPNSCNFPLLLPPPSQRTPRPREPQNFRTLHSRTMEYLGEVCTHEYHAQHAQFSPQDKIRLFLHKEWLVKNDLVKSVPYLLVRALVFEILSELNIVYLFTQKFYVSTVDQYCCILLTDTKHVWGEGVFPTIPGNPSAYSNGLSEQFSVI